MSLPDTLYARLTPLERLRAVTSAVARGDLAERDKLFDTCDKRTYKAADHQFTGRDDALDLIVLAHYGDVHKKALLGMAALAVVIGLESLLSDCDNLTEEQERQWDNYILGTARLKDVAALVMGMERGFERFCEALGLSADEVRKSHNVTKVHVVTADELLSEPFEMIALERPEPEAVAVAEREAYKLYCELWSRQFRDIRNATAGGVA